MRAIVIADEDSLVERMVNESADVIISVGDIWDSTIEKARAVYGRHIGTDLISYEVRKKHKP